MRRASNNEYKREESVFHEGQKKGRKYCGLYRIDSDEHHLAVSFFRNSDAELPFLCNGIRRSGELHHSQTVFPGQLPLPVLRRDKLSALVSQYGHHCILCFAASDDYCSVCGLCAVENALCRENVPDAVLADSRYVPGLPHHDLHVLPAEAVRPDTGRRGSGSDPGHHRQLRHAVLCVQGIF